MRKEIELFNLLTEELFNQEEKNPTAKFLASDDLFDKLDLSLSSYPINDKTLVNNLKEIIAKTPKTSSKTFFNQLFGGRNPKAILGDLLAVMLNNSMYTYKAAGAQVGIEKAVISKACELIGFNENCGGTFASGGSLTNLMAMLMARDASCKDVVMKGVNKKMIIYTSEDSHYSIPKNASFIGIGKENIRYIPCDKFGSMEIMDLKLTIEKDIELGYTPIMVNATAGTTVLGAFDPIEKIVSICKNHNIWLHIDGAYCGSVFVSKKYKYLINGVKDADSFSFNAHKMMGVPLTCSIILVKDKNKLFNSFSIEANYLYQTNQDEFNLGKTSLQCGRRNDALKIWTLWKSIGTEGLEKMIDYQFYLADFARDYVKNNPNYELYSFDNSISVCFNYKGLSPKEICTALYEKSELLVGYGTFKENEFIRLVTINAQNSKEDILNFFKILETFVDKSHDKMLKSKEV